ncbi:penicillin-binding protein 2 [Serratia plymuthica 4Rx13]|nr:penicillin-binding protein 2 [Serratia plymuthica 4Rx13]
MALLKEKIRDHSAEEMLFIRRACVAMALVIACFGALIVNLYHLQIKQHAFYQTRSNQNDIKMLPIAPSRGLIFDRNGIPLVRNITLYQIQVIPSKIANMAALLQALTPIVDLTPEDIATFRDDMHHNGRYKPVTLKSGLNDTEVARFAVNQYRFDGVTIDTYQQREYPYGAELAHVVGYVSKINDGDVKRLDKAGIGENYSADHNIGKQGIEAYYESELHGTTGYQEVEVDNHGRVIRLLKEQPPQAGKNIYLTLDLPLQQYIESVLKGQRAAVVVEDPRDGGILAMVSSPSYDPNPFVKGISYKAYKSLLTNPDLPLINRVTQGAVPAGVYREALYGYLCAVRRGDNPQHQLLWRADLDVAGYPTPLPRLAEEWPRYAERHQSDRGVRRYLLYQVAFEMGIDRIHSWLSQFGYGQATGIDLNEEYRGVLPSRDWKQRVHKKPWYQGDTVSVGIGQGYWVATPIQMVKALTTLINNGKVKTPHLLYSMRQGNRVSRYQPPLQTAQIGDVKSPYWGIVRNGMYGMANLPNGTGYKLFHTAPYQIAAKSGTSQVFSLKENQTYNAKMIPVRLRDHIFYTLFAPYKNPRVAMALILENGGGDGVVAGPTARAILDHIFDPANAPKPDDGQKVKPELNDSEDVQQ